MDFENLLAVFFVFVVVVVGSVLGTLIHNFYFAPSDLSVSLDEDVSNSDLLGALRELGGFRVNESLCGNNQFLVDSNRVNEFPRGIVYSCFAPGLQKEALK